MLGDGLQWAFLPIGNQRTHLIMLSLHSLKSLLPLVLICSGSVDKSGKAYFLVSFTVMWNPIAVRLFCHPPPFAIMELGLRQVEESPWHTYLCVIVVSSVDNKTAVGGRCIFCLLSRGRKGGSGSCGGLAADERSAVSGRAGHLITEWVLLHHHQSHTGSHLPSILSGLCSSEADMVTAITQGHWKQQSCILRHFLPFFGEGSRCLVSLHWFPVSLAAVSKRLTKTEASQLPDAGNQAWKTLVKLWGGVWHLHTWVQPPDKAIASLGES